MGDATPRVLDLFCGLGGATQAMRDRGWTVVGIDIMPPADVIADVRRCPVAGAFDLVWASPPCTYFSRSALPWFRDEPPPSLDLVKAALAVIERLRPRYWLLENVRGAIPWIDPLLGKWRYHLGAAFLWGTLPNVRTTHVAAHKGSGNARRYRQLREAGADPQHRSPRLRSKIPPQTSVIVADALADALAGVGQLALFGRNENE
jgi:site-specific DNA-cytosine methylase